MDYFNAIEERLTHLSTRVKIRGKLNLLDTHVHSENFYRDLFNILYGWKSINLNISEQNVEAIDLIDHKNLLVIQVSATATKRKIEDSLTKELIKNYKDYTFKFISITDAVDKLKKVKFNNPHSIKFEPDNDLLDIKSILKEVFSLSIDELKSLFDFIEKELSNKVDFARVESNLAGIINIISREDLGLNNPVHQTIPFEIENKILFNQLTAARNSIHEYSILSHRIDAIYSEFDKQGSNRSASVLSAFQKVYIETSSIHQGDLLFAQIIDEILNRVNKSANRPSIPSDEIEMCVILLTVDAFMRCKIFENPENFNATS